MYWLHCLSRRSSPASGYRYIPWMWWLHTISMYNVRMLQKSVLIRIEFSNNCTTSLHTAHGSCIFTIILWFDTQYHVSDWLQVLRCPGAHRSCRLKYQTRRLPASWLTLFSTTENFNLSEWIFQHLWLMNWYNMCSLFPSCAVPGQLQWAASTIFKRTTTLLSMNTTIWPNDVFRFFNGCNTILSWMDVSQSEENIWSSRSFPRALYHTKVSMSAGREVALRNPKELEGVLLSGRCFLVLSRLHQRCQGWLV